MITLVSLLFITMIPIDCKITNFSLYLYYIIMYFTSCELLRIPVKNMFYVLLRMLT